MSDQIEPAEFYVSKSKGKTPIRGMANKHLRNSLNILETREPYRVAEILGMRAEVERQDVEYAVTQAEADPVKPDYAPGVEVPVFDPNPRAAIGGNEPPEETPFELDEVFDAVDAAEGPSQPNVSGYWSAQEITIRNTVHIEALGKVTADAAAIVAVADDSAAETAANIVLRLRKVRTDGEAAFTAEKAPILAAGRICDDFGRPFKALETEQKRVERLIGAHQTKVAEDRRQALAKAAADEKAKADELVALAAQQETTGNDVVAEILMDHAEKAETFAGFHTRAAEGPITDLGRTVTATANISLSGPWTAEIADLNALRASFGVLGAFLTPDAMLTAAKAYVRANVSDKKFVGAQLAGVRIFQDVRGRVS